MDKQRTIRSSGFKKNFSNFVATKNCFLKC
jgi:hypothetical protein